MLNGEQLMEIRDRLFMKCLSFGQIIRDLQAENLTEAAKLFADFETELLRLKGEQ